MTKRGTVRFGLWLLVTLNLAIGIAINAQTAIAQAEEVEVVAEAAAEEDGEATDGDAEVKEQPAEAADVATEPEAKTEAAPVAKEEAKPADKPDAAKADPAKKDDAAATEPAKEKPPETVTLEPEKPGVAAAKTAKTEKAKDNLGQRREGDVSQSEELGFLQSKITAQMLELEERMYRLSEALKSLEPENASRLLIGLKYAREELIQLQMKEIQSALTSSNYHDAIVEQKQLLAKLQRLEQLLLSPDLDFQLQLERLRLMKELLKRLDAAIREEEREKAQTEQTVALEKRLKDLQERLPSLRELINRQAANVKAGEQLSAPADAEKASNDGSATQNPANDEVSRPTAIESLTNEQQTTRQRTEPLESFAEPIATAGSQMDKAIDSLKKSQSEAALPHQTSALDSLKSVLKSWEDDEKKLEAALADEKFAALRRDQAKNRKTTEGISENAVQLGDSGSNARSELIRAIGSMSNAESSFGGRNASAADTSQDEALASLKYARELLSAEVEKLQNRLRSEVKKRSLEGIVEMLEGQIAIRESTERLEPKVKHGARAVLTSVVALSTAEGKLITIGEAITTLVEETEFGIALPAVLKSVTDAMSEVKDRLAVADASQEVIEAEKQIEVDLQELLEAMKQLPSQKDSDDKKAPKGGGAERRLRQLNKLIAELRMVRMLQVRVNRDTKDADGKRPAEISDLPGVLRKRIEALHDRQEDVHDVTEQISVDRADELLQ